MTTIIFAILFDALILTLIAAGMARLGICPGGIVPLAFIAGLVAPALVMAFFNGAFANDRNGRVRP